METSICYKLAQYRGTEGNMLRPPCQAWAPGGDGEPSETRGCRRKSQDSGGGRQSFLRHLLAVGQRVNYLHFPDRFFLPCK